MIPTFIQKSIWKLILFGLVLGLGLPSIVESEMARAQGASESLEDLIPEF